MNHAQALQAAMDVGLTHGNSIYGYRPRRLLNMCREVERVVVKATKTGDDFYSRGESANCWHIQFNADGTADIWNDGKSEIHHCWKGA